MEHLAQTSSVAICNLLAARRTLASRLIIQERQLGRVLIALSPVIASSKDTVELTGRRLIRFFVHWHHPGNRHERKEYPAIDLPRGSQSPRQSSKTPPLHTDQGRQRRGRKSLMLRDKICGTSGVRVSLNDLYLPSPNTHPSV